jgi:hypothetical protein
MHLISTEQLVLCTTAQAQDLGISYEELRHLSEQGWLRSVRRGVFAFSGRLPSKWEPILAASLAGGPAAIISHQAAAAVHGFWGVIDADPELTIVGSAGRRMAGVRIHHSTGFDPKDIVERHGAHLTSPIRTLIDLAPAMNAYGLPRMIDEGSIGRLWTPEDITARLDQFSTGRRGSKRLRDLLEERQNESRPDSALEQRAIRIVKRWLPGFVVHYRVTLGGRVIEFDIAWPDYLLAAEIDGRSVRVASRTKFDSDRVRSNLLESHGWRVVHLTSTMDEHTLVAQLVPFFPDHLVEHWRLRAGGARRSAVSNG